MKRIFLVFGILGAGGVAFCAIHSAGWSNQQKLEQARTEWMKQSQELAQAQSDVEALSERVRDLKNDIPPVSRDAALIELLATNDFKSLPVEQQGRVLSELAANARSADNYVFVPKAVLAKSQVNAFGKFPNAWQLTPAAQQILAITPDEQKSVEEAFADAFRRETDWAQAHVQRSGASNDMLVSFTLPVDRDFADGLRNELFSTVGNTLGEQRMTLLKNYFDIERVYEDGAVAVNTNKLIIWRVPGKAGFYQQAGWDMGNWSAMNSFPEPARASLFPAAFRFIFPGGWQELAKREGLEWVDPAVRENK